MKVTKILKFKGIIKNYFHHPSKQTSTARLLNRLCYSSLHEILTRGEAMRGYCTNELVHMKIAMWVNNLH